MDAREGAQPGEVTNALVNRMPLFAIRSNAGVSTNVDPDALVCGKDWSSEMAIRIFGLFSGSACWAQPRTNRPSKIAQNVSLERATSNPVLNGHTGIAAINDDFRAGHE
jgi:hypothetical protein